MARRFGFARHSPPARAIARGSQAPSSPEFAEVARDGGCEFRLAARQRFATCRGEHVCCSGGIARPRLSSPESIKVCWRCFVVTVCRLSQVFDRGAPSALVGVDAAQVKMRQAKARLQRYGPFKLV